MYSNQHESFVIRRYILLLLNSENDRWVVRQEEHLHYSMEWLKDYWVSKIEEYLNKKTDDI
jgi:hypothetical protein